MLKQFPTALIRTIDNTRALAAAGLLTGVLAGCAVVGPAANGDAKSAAAPAGTPPVVVSVPATGAAPGTTPPATPPPSPTKPFADVIKDAKVIPGYFTLYQKEEKVWIEIMPDQFDRPFFFQANRNRGIGERRGLINPMMRAHIAELHKIGDLIQLLAKNERFIAKPDTALARAVRENMERIEQLEEAVRQTQKRVETLDQKRQREHGVLARHAHRELELACAALQRQDTQLKRLVDDLGDQELAMQTLDTLLESGHRKLSAEDWDELAIRIEEQQGDKQDALAARRGLLRLGAGPEVENEPVDVEATLAEIRGVKEKKLSAEPNGRKPERWEADS